MKHLQFGFNEIHPLGPTPSYSPTPARFASLSARAGRGVFGQWDPGMVAVDCWRFHGIWWRFNRVCLGLNVDPVLVKSNNDHCKVSILNQEMVIERERDSQPMRFCLIIAGPQNPMVLDSFRPLNLMGWPPTPAGPRWSPKRQTSDSGKISFPRLHVFEVPLVPCYILGIAIFPHFGHPLMENSH